MKKCFSANYTRMLLLAILFVFFGFNGWGQTTFSWNFGTTSGSDLPSGSLSHLTVGNISIGNTNGSVTMLSTTSVSSGYTGASGLYNAGNAARIGALNTGASGSAYFEFTLTPDVGYSVELSSISFGTRSTSTAPQAYTLRSSLDSYGSDIATGTIANNSTWALKSNSGLTFTGTSGTAVTFRVYGYNGAGTPTANTINWRIDDLSIIANVSGGGGGSTPPTLIADATNTDVDNNIDITFVDDATWRAAVTEVKIGGTALTPTTDYVLSSGNLQLIPSGGNPLLTTSGSKSVSVVATGYTDATVSQDINAGAATKLGMKTQPTSPATNGAALAAQPAVYIQDQYGNTTTSTAIVDAAVGAGSWALGGTVSVAAASGTVTYSGLTATGAGVVGATITFSSAGLTGVTSNAFNIPCEVATLPLIENFNYSAADILTNNCWTAHSGGGTNPITVEAGSITYPGYPSSGIGNQVSLTTSGEDDNIAFTSQNAGTVYAAFLVNVPTATGTGDYFAHFGTASGASVGTYTGKIFVKGDGANIAFGVSKGGTAVYTASVYSPVTTHLIVIKYEMVAGTLNDNVQLFVDPSFGASEPVATLTYTDIASSDPAQLSSFCLRQTTNIDDGLIFDGLRIANTWGEVLSYAWEGTTSTDWHVASNWSDGVVPTMTDNAVIIPQTNQPQISASAVCGNLVITPGASLTINTLASLSVTANFVIQSDAAGIGSLIDNGTLNVGASTVVQRWVGTNGTSRWEYVSAPVSGAVSGMFTSPTRGLWYADETTNSWVSILNSAPTTPLTVMKGYTRKYVLAENDGDACVSFVGTGNVLNTGAKSINVTRSEGAPGVNHGYNLVGNPYPSSMDWDAVSGWTRTGIDAAIYFRSNGNYGTWTPGSPGVGTNGATSIIPPMQAYWVRVSYTGSDVSTTLGCNNNVRVHSAQNIYKSEFVNTLHLTATDKTNNLTDDTYIRFNQDATDVFDSEYDAYKMFAADSVYPQVYTNNGTDDIAINSLSDLVGERTIPLGFKTTLGGQFEFSADLVYSFIQNGNTVFLEDLQTGTYQDLSANSTYLFTSGVTSGFGRFILHFNPTTTVSEIQQSNVLVFSNRNDVHITSPEMLNGDVTVYDILGHVVTSKHFSGTNSGVITLNPESAVYIVKYTSSEQTISRKIFINQ